MGSRLRALVFERLMQQAHAMIVLIRHPNAPRQHGHHTERAVELPERRALAAPGPRALQLTGNVLHPNTTHVDITQNKIEKNIRKKQIQNKMKADAPGREATTSAPPHEDFRSP